MNLGGVVNVRFHLQEITNGPPLCMYSLSFHNQGQQSGFADLLSRMAERIGEAVKQREGIPMMYPLGKSADTEQTEGNGTPTGYTAMHLALSIGWRNGNQWRKHTIQMKAGCNQ